MYRRYVQQVTAAARVRLSVMCLGVGYLFTMLQGCVLLGGKLLLYCSLYRTCCELVS
jgi:hypothetical protein